MKEHGLMDDPFEDVELHFPFADGAVTVIGTLGMNKARVMGWTGYVDTTQGIFEMYSEMAKLKMLPPMKVRESAPLM